MVAGTEVIIRSREDENGVLADRLSIRLSSDGEIYTISKYNPTTEETNVMIIGQYSLGKIAEVVTGGSK